LDTRHSLAGPRSRYYSPKFNTHRDIALGIGVLLALMPAAFDALLLAGSLYMAWIGWSILRSAAAFDLEADMQVRPPWATFRRGFLTSVLNPKAYLFTLAVYPQFIRPEYGSIAVQAVAIWLVIAATELGVYGTVVAAAHGVRRWLSSRPQSGIVIARVVGAVLILGAVYTGVSSWRTM
jgi:threonine/homoserine/homoserine lactone efflux protein